MAPFPSTVTCIFVILYFYFYVNSKAISSETSVPPQEIRMMSNQSTDGKIMVFCCCECEQRCFFAESLDGDRECDAHTCHVSEERGQVFNWIGCDECEKWFAFIALT